MKFFSLREGKGSFGGWVCSNGLCQLLIILGVAIELGVKVEPANVGIRERRTTGLGTIHSSSLLLGTKCKHNDEIVY